MIHCSAERGGGGRGDSETTETLRQAQGDSLGGAMTKTALWARAPYRRHARREECAGDSVHGTRAGARYTGRITDRSRLGTVDATHGAECGGDTARYTGNGTPRQSGAATKTGKAGRAPQRQGGEVGWGQPTLHRKRHAVSARGYNRGRLAEEVPFVAVEVLEDDDVAVGFVTWFLLEADAASFQVVIVAPEIIGSQKEKYATAGLVADVAFLVGG